MGLGGAAFASRALGQPVGRGDVILGPADWVRLEHSDRTERIRRATRRAGVQPEPGFSTTVVPAERMPAGLAVDTPVLRVSFSERTFFDTAQHTLLAQGRRVVTAVAEAVRGEAPDVALFVAGHTDSRGSEAYNHNLSVARAETVAQALEVEGVGEVALWRVGFGEAVPLYPNDTAEHLSFNRRVEFLFSARTEPVLDVLSRVLDEPCIAADRAAADRCRREVEVRPAFEVRRISRRPVRVDLPAGGTRIGAGASGASVAQAPASISIDLPNRSVSIGVPIR